MPTIDWTISASNLLTYLGVLVVLAWRIGNKMTDFEGTIKNHANQLQTHSALITRHDERFTVAAERVGEIAADLQRLVGRTETFFERRREPRD